jgi:RNA polymerase sigma-70 factor, ECF subfamily
MRNNVCMAVAPEASPAVLAPAASETAEQLYEEHSGWIYGYCLRLLRSPEEAEDAVQTTYLNACRSLQQGTRPKVGSAWLLRIAQNVCFARMRSSGRRGRLERIQDTAILAETVAAPQHSPDALIGLTEALCSLPERQREAILLREWQGLSYQEVAQRMGLTQAAVETLLFRARRSLAAALEAPAERGRRKALHALDVGGLAAALKGLFAGSAGVKVAAVTVVAATTAAVVVATDPVGGWRDRPELGTSRSRPAVADEARAAPPPTSVSSAAPIVALPEPSGSRAATEQNAGHGRGFGQETGAAAKATTKENNGKGHAHGHEKGRDQGNGNGRALGHAKKAAPNGSQGHGSSPSRSRTDASGRSRQGSPAHAQAKGHAKKDKDSAQNEKRPRRAAPRSRASLS